MSSPMTDRRSPDAESIGKESVPLDQRLQGAILHVACEPFDIETGGAGSGEDMIEADGAVRPRQRPVKRLVEVLRP